MISAWLQAHWLPTLLLGGYGAMLVHHAFLGRRETKDLTDFFVGGRSMGGLVLGMSFFATFASTNAFVGLAGQSYTFGAPWLLFIPAFIACSLIAWIVVAPRFRAMTEELDSVTLADFVGSRYSSQASRVIVGAIIAVASVFYMTAIYRGSGLVLSSLLSIPYEAAIFLVLIITMSYTMVGGFKSVVRTDAVQGGVMLLAAFAFVSFLLPATGGPGVLFELPSRPETEQLFQWNTAIPLALMLGLIFSGAIKIIIEPRQLSRFYGLRDQAAVRRGMIVSMTAFLVLFALLLPVGMLAHIVLPETITDTDLVLPTLLEQPFMPEAVAALILVAVASAAMSSLDSVLLVSASVCQSDLVAPIVPVARKHGIAVTRVFIAILSVTTALVSLNPPGGIIELTAISGSLYSVCLGPAVIGALLWKRGNGTAVIASIAVGVVVMLFWRAYPPASLHEVFPATAVSAVVYWLWSVATEAARPTLALKAQR